MTTQFETGKLYGNDLTIEIVKRTEKTVTIQTVAWGEKRIKIKAWNDKTECVLFKAWIILATENFNEDEARTIAFEKAYN
jgi:hypothetical protein